MSPLLVLLLLAIALNTARGDGWCDPPDFESDWFVMDSRVDALSLVDVAHGVDGHPYRATVTYRADPVEYPLFSDVYMDAIGSALRDRPGPLSSAGNGLVFGWDDVRVRVWAPRPAGLTDAGLTSPSLTAPIVGIGVCSRSRGSIVARDAACRV
jgi:hypothetical protein